MCQSDNGANLDHVPTAEELMSMYERSQENDPTSVHYKRVNVRPKLHIWLAILYILVTFAICTGVSFLVYLAWQTRLGAILAGVAWLILMIAVHAKHICIWLVKVYQRTAPEKTRNRCRFEPSCSQYMILSLQKYGFWKGFKKGLQRWIRCKPPNGGYDEP